MISIAFGGVCSDKTIIHVHLNFKVVKKYSFNTIKGTELLELIFLVG